MSGRPENQMGSSMRTAADRIRHAISFEIIGLLIVVLHADRLIDTNCQTNDCSNTQHDEDFILQSDPHQ